MGLINWSGLSAFFIFLLCICAILWIKGYFSILSRLTSHSKFITFIIGLLLLLGITLVIIPLESIDSSGISKPIVVVLFVYFWFINPIVCLIGMFEFINLIKNFKSVSGFNPQRRKFIKKASLCSLAFVNLGIFIKPLFITSEDLQIKEFHIDFQCSKGVSIAFISDLHAGFYLSNSILNRVVKTIKDKNPDIILIGGDLVDHNINDISELDLFIDELIKICPVVSVLGNHDIISGSLGVERFLKNKGVVVLRDEAIEITENIVLCGLKDEKQEKINPKFIKDIKEEKKVIVLSHSPKAIYKFDNLELKKTKLFLSGHTHGGQIRIPGIGALVNPGGLEFQVGLIRLNPEMPPMIITSGIGYTGIPLRINCEPEVVFVNLSLETKKHESAHSCSW